MNDNLEQYAKLVNDESKAVAVQVHAEIMINMRAAADAFVEVCKKLKQMRDEKLYEALGFSKFEDYVIEKVGIKQRQAYTYIKIYENLSPKLLESNAGLGVTKLELLTQVTAPDREDFVNDNDLSKMSVSEIKALIEEKNGLFEQVSLLTEEKDDAVISESNYKKIVDELNGQICALNEKITIKDNLINDLGKEPVEAYVDDSKVQEAVAIAVEEYKNKLDVERMEFEAACQENANKQITDAENKAQEKFAMQLQAEQAEKEQLSQEAKRLQGELAKGTDENSIKFMVLFEQLQDVYASIMQCSVDIRANGNAMHADKMRNALKGAMLQMVEDI